MYFVQYSFENVLLLTPFLKNRHYYEAKMNPFLCLQDMFRISSVFIDKQFGSTSFQALKCVYFRDFLKGLFLYHLFYMYIFFCLFPMRQCSLYYRFFFNFRLIYGWRRGPMSVDIFWFRLSFITLQLIL